jgi:hypothetical protein
MLNIVKSLKINVITFASNAYFIFDDHLGTTQSITDTNNNLIYIIEIS